MARAADVPRDLIVLGNVLFELQQLVGCSGLLVSAERSATGGPLYGRNFDFHCDDLIGEYSLVIVYRPAGGKAFAMVTFPGLLASSCGINENGLTLGANTVRESGDGSPAFDPTGIPFAVAAREVMEKCISVEDFDCWIRRHRPSGRGLLPACDQRQQRVYEITTRNLGVREPSDGLIWCTNHFRLTPMAVDTHCKRYEILAKSRQIERLSVGDVARLLHEVNQGKRTVQTMVFEPQKLVLHLSIGRGPTSAKPLERLELAPLFDETKNMSENRSKPLDFQERSGRPQASSSRLVR